eukprot:739782-Pyramimonas_sp.AAC.1
MGTNTNTGGLPPQGEDDPGRRCWWSDLGHPGNQNHYHHRRDRDRLPPVGGTPPILVSVSASG